MAQVNAIVLDRTVDSINALINPEGFAWSKAAHILTIITIVLLGKEIIAAGRGLHLKKYMMLPERHISMIR